MLSAVESVTKQNFNRQNFEIIVVKGFEDTLIDKELENHNVRNILLNEKSLGSKIATGIEQAQGDIILLLDDDDEFVSNKLQTISEIFDRYPEIDFIHNSLVKIDEKGYIIDSSPMENPEKNLLISVTSMKDSELSKVLRYRGDWFLSCMSFRKQVVSHSLGSLRDSNQSIDKFIFFLALNHGRNIQLIPDKLTKYRMHISTTTYSGTMNDFIYRREVFFSNSVKVFSSIVKLSRPDRRREFAECQLIQHRINLFFISGRKDYHVPVSEFLVFLKCLKFARSRYQIVWIAAYIMRRISLRLSVLVYYRFLKLSFQLSGAI